MHKQVHILLKPVAVLPFQKLAWKTRQWKSCDGWFCTKYQICCTLLQGCHPGHVHSQSAPDELTTQLTMMHNPSHIPGEKCGSNRVRYILVHGTQEFVALERIPCMENPQDHPVSMQHFQLDFPTPAKLFFWNDGGMLYQIMKKIF